MKVAIPIFGNRISPRFDFSPEMWIIEVERGEVVSQEKLPTANLNLPRRLEQITSNGVDKVICGGIDGFSLNQLGSKGIDVLEDVIGEAETAFDLFMRGRLRPGFCCEKRGGETYVWLEERPALEGVNKISDLRFQIEKKTLKISKAQFQNNSGGLR